MSNSYSWSILQTYFSDNSYSITKHHLQSYNDFVKVKIPIVIKSLNPFTILKNDSDGDKLFTIEVYIGGEQGDDVFIAKPHENGVAVFPNICRLQNKTYSTDVTCNILIKYIHHKENDRVIEQELKNIKLANIPVMLHSHLCILNNQYADVLTEMGECSYDQGGYFIIDGKEKVIVSQERNVTNKLFIAKNKSDEKFKYSGFIRCMSEQNSVFPKTIKFDVLSRGGGEGKENAIVVTIPHIRAPIPLFILFRALGIESDQEIIRYIGMGEFSSSTHQFYDFIIASVRDGNMLYTQKEALAYIGLLLNATTTSRQTDAPNFEDISKKVMFTLHENLFPNVDNTFHDKALFLGFLTNKLVKTCMGVLDDVDRDNYMFRRISLSGFLMADLFKDLYNEFRNNCRSLMDKEYEVVIKGTTQITELITKANTSIIFDPNIITQGFRKSLKGNWGLESKNNPNKQDAKQGIVQDLSRLSYMSFMSHLRRVNTPLSDSAKIVEPHRLSGSQWGVMCPCESPDGASIGLLKNFALLCHVTSDVSTQQIMNVLFPFKVDLLKDCKITTVPGKLKLLINNSWVGLIDGDGALVYKFMKVMKALGLIDIHTSIVWNVFENELSILCDNGRCTRPLLRVDNGQLLPPSKPLKWKHLIKASTQISLQDIKEHLRANNSDFDQFFAWVKQYTPPLEFIDVQEANTLLLAMNENVLDKSKSFTHCEIHPTTMFSVYTATIPFANHNQAPRNIFSGAQGKQAIGVYATNFNNRIDTMSYTMHYPQRPLVSTKFNDWLQVNQLPNGENLIVAIATYTGYNQEDSIIVNKGSIERGMFNITYYKSHVAYESSDLNNDSHVQTIFANTQTSEFFIDKVTNVKTGANYKTLDEHGFPKLDSFIQENDVILGKSLTISTISEDKNVTEYIDQSDVANKTLTGFVDKVYVCEAKEKQRLCKIRLRQSRKPEFGDKLASRHGQKGVVGMILPQDVMPFTESGLTPDIIINPHAFPTRMTVAHLIECVVAKLCVHECTTYDGTTFEVHDFERIYDDLGFHCERYGNEIMYNGMTGQQMDTEIFIGPTYYLRLKHMVADKINFRHKGRKTNVTKQPTKGRGNDGGMRIGEMERDAILSHGAQAFLKESFMERSDKAEMFIDSDKKVMTYVNPNKVSLDTHGKIHKAQIPHSFKILMHELNTLNINPLVEMQSDLDSDSDYYSENEDFENSTEAEQTQNT